MKKPLLTGLILWFIWVSSLYIFFGCQNKIDKSGSELNSPDDYNVVWETPSENQYGSMPVGNGNIGLNVWVEGNGDICFYIGKTDSWGDNGRLLKVGKVRVKCSPAIVFPGSEFKQELDLKTGTIRISSSGIYDGKQTNFNLQVYVDANHPVVYVTNESSVPLKMSATIELWRIEPYSLPELSVSDLMEDRSKPRNLHEPVIVEPDVIIQGSKKYIGWYHYNKKSVGFDLTNKLQGLSEFVKEDPILHRTFGAIISGTGSNQINYKTLETSSAKSGRLNVYVLTQQPSSPEKWLHTIATLMAQTEAVSFEERLQAHMKWWSDFWNRSWIHATMADNSDSAELDEAFIVSRAYALQRFIDACAGRGRYPIKFNGSIFTVPYPDKPGDADYRRWGPGYWWQNTRLPYLSMCAAGDYDLMQSFFNMYSGEIFTISKARTKKYFGIEGAYFPECMNFWGCVFTSTYGWTPYEERTDPLQESGYHKWEWVAGPELVFMMLDYYDYTQDTVFLHEKIIPVANQVMKFFDNYYNTDQSGKLVMHPAQAAETWWDSTNPMPELAGLHSITRRLLALPKNLSSKNDRQYWEVISAKLPDIPLRDTPSGKALAPAAHFENKRNVENPELYAVFPFRLFGIGNPNINWAVNALEHRWDKGDFGWRQDDIFMTYLGLTDEAKNNLVGRARSYDKNSRFPAFWGPNYDWTPDQDHGGVLMKAFQSMIMQADPYSQNIYLFPAWPQEWNVGFKLYAPYNTVIKGQIRNGTITNLKVTPQSRRKDIILKNFKKSR